MKKVVVSLCIALILIGLPCSSFAADGKAGSLVTIPLLGATVGAMAGVVVAVAAGSSEAGPVLLGAGIGLGLGLLVALFLPSEEEREEKVAQPAGVPPGSPGSESP